MVGDVLVFAEKVVGQQIACYTIGKIIATGGMGSVHYAHGPDVSEPLAIKILRPDYSQDEEFRKRFEREAYLLMRLDHPHILPVYDYGRADGLMFLVMRLVRGPSLYQLQTRRHFSPSSAYQLLEPLAEALDYAHDNAVIHRDIKPGNILIEADATNGSNVYLADFGLSKLIGDTLLTRVGKSVGTPQYMSPEQVLDHPLDRRSDIYSLGLLAYELLLGRLPYYAKTAQQVAFKHVKELPPTPRQLSPAFPEPLENVLMRALAKNPKERYATAGEFSAAYGEALQQINAESRKVDYWVGAPL